MAAAWCRWQRSGPGNGASARATNGQGRRSQRWSPASCGCGSVSFGGGQGGCRCARPAASDRGVRAWRRPGACVSGGGHGGYGRATNSCGQGVRAWRRPAACAAMAAARETNGCGHGHARVEVPMVGAGARDRRLQPWACAHGGDQGGCGCVRPAAAAVGV
nr:uncharacterized protein LOC127315833 [Lolium perenne]